MKYNRKQLCILADMQLEHFKTMHRRFRAGDYDALPVSSLEDVGDESTGYEKYSTDDVVRLAIAVTLSRAGGYLHGGLSFPLAAKIAANAHAPVWQAPGSSPCKLYVGYASYDDSDAGGRNLFGNWGEIESQLSGDGLSRLFMVEITAVVAGIQKRAAAAGIKFSGGSHDNND